VSLIYRGLRYPSRWLLQAMADIRIEGEERLPRSGPLVLVPNHQSLADPFLVQAFCTRPVHSMTKSTQFDSRFFRWLIPRLHGFPVRRYRVDPQAVRILLRLLDEGRVVCVYPEGERSWDGGIQPFRRGALKVLLYAGAPIVPVGIHGMTHLWPRWLRLPRPAYGPRIPVTVRFGEPIRLGAVRDREERERMVPDLDRILHERLERLARSREEGGGAEAGAAEPLTRVPSAEGPADEPGG
jgi:1-acyl-sn-glycerol-3-phosphate acyltransferase